MLLLILVLFFLSSGGDLYDRVSRIWDWGESTWAWRSEEYAKLADLRAGYTIDKFDDVLGAPLFAEPSPDGLFLESTFRGRGYWVQAVTSRDSASVLYFAVTSCSTAFNPTFRLPDGTPITLNKATLASVGGGGYIGDFADYFFPGATANAHFYEIQQGGNPGNYKTFAWGHNDACLNLRPWTRYIRRRLFDEIGVSGVFRGAPWEARPALRAFRSKIPVNTYAETAPGGSFADAAGAFQVGPDRILIRTVTHASYGDGKRSGIRSQRGDVPRPPPGSELMQRAWRCFQSPLMFAGSMISGSEAIAARRAPPRMASYVSGGFLLARWARFPGRANGEQGLTIFFARDEAEARRAERAIRRREGGFVTRRQFSVIVVRWRLHPSRAEELLIQACAW